jgi:hypothetical protein
MQSMTIDNEGRGGRGFWTRLPVNKVLAITFLMLLGCVAAQAQIGSNKCDDSLTRFVYSPYRFRTPVTKKNDAPLAGRCVQVRGTIKYDLKPPGPDGDVHISLIPDSKSILRPKQTALVVEVICVDATPRNGYARKACKGYQNPPELSWSRLRFFKKGQRVQIIGLQVVDYLHLASGWTEIHPVTRIELLPAVRRR